MNGTGLEKLRGVDASAISEAAAVLRRGGVVAFPTETVYGLGADATSQTAVAALFAAKRRPGFNPLIVHVENLRAAQELGRIPENALQLAERFWPGALTLVVPRGPRCSVSLLATAGLDTIALRVPSHPVTAAIIAQAGIPIAAPSANLSGRVSATAASHVHDELGASIDLILDGGTTPLGLESTVLAFESGRAVLLRPGAVPREEIEQVIGPLAASRSRSVKSPGQLDSHYAPRATLRLNAKSLGPDEALLAFGPANTLQKGALASLNLSPAGELREAASNLFAMLRALDAYGTGTIAVMAIPETGLGEAINDRLRRAAAPREPRR